MAVNKYPATCVTCHNKVDAMAGTLIRGEYGWEVYHLACHDSGHNEVMEVYFPSTGKTYIRNRNGRCEDAPCCGCCTI